MSFFDDLCNRHLCEEFECACGINVTLFTADGFTFFGLLDRVDDGIITLVPAAGFGEVKVRTPGGDTFKEDISYIDFCTVVAISKNTINNPFNCLHDKANAGDANRDIDRNNTCRLIRILNRLEGEEDVIMRTVGGFQFDEGRLVRVDDQVATASDVEVRLPGGGTIELGNVAINLCALTSVSVDDD